MPGRPRIRTIRLVLLSFLVATSIPAASVSRAAQRSTATGETWQRVVEAIRARKPGSAEASSGSNASNYSGGTHVQVNSRTGTVTIRAPIFQVKGERQLDAALELRYRAEDAMSNAEAGRKLFNLPYGWTTNLTHWVNTGSETQLHVDGTQSYAIDVKGDWTTQLTPTGVPDSIPIFTGLLELNRADVNYRKYSGPVEVDGIPAYDVLSTLDGKSRYLAPYGLLLQESDRFGKASITYHYNGYYAADDTDLQIVKITDTWGNDLTFTYCVAGQQCATGMVPGQVMVHRADGSLLGGWVAANDDELTQIIDAQGKATIFEWEDTTCQKPTAGRKVLKGVTSPDGGFTALEHTCMNVCTARALSSAGCVQDGNTTTWPVVKSVVTCPSASSGTHCPSGATQSDYMTTIYTVAQEKTNYTGFPMWSPYAPSVPGADALMSSGDSSFTYDTTQTKQDSHGEDQLALTDTYDFLHLKTGSETRVRVDNAMKTAKEVSYCYETGQSDCSVDELNYRNLPANYQSPRILGTCVYDVEGGDGSARLSVVERAHDGFGKLLKSKRYHGTVQTGSGVLTSCSTPDQRLDPSGLKLVMETYHAYDTPQPSGEDVFLDLGTQSGKYGLLTGSLSFSYLDDDESEVAAHGPVAETEGPIRVALTCNTLTDASSAPGAGAAIATQQLGSLATTTPAPTTPGVIEACTKPAWDTSVEPPKLTRYSWDGYGRRLSQELTWGVTPPPAGVTSRKTTWSYSLIPSVAGEPVCGAQASEPRVFQTIKNDAGGHATKSRLL